MSEKNLTVWQRLSQAFGPNSLLNQDYPTLKFDKKELLRTQDKEQYERTVNDSSVDFGVLAEQVMGGNDKSVNNE